MCSRGAGAAGENEDAGGGEALDPALEQRLDDELAARALSVARVHGTQSPSAPVSFVSRPCVLPLVPGYLSAVSSIEAERLGEPGASRRVVISSLPFVAGLVTVFVLLGAGAAAVGLSFVRNQFLLEQVAGLVLIVFGFVFMGLLPWPQRLMGAGLVQGARRRGSGFLLGGAFAICAAPCIGPVLGSILVLAGDSDTVLEGSLLLAVYALGLAVPFLIAAALFVPAMGLFRRVRDHYVAIQFVSGLILVSFGALLFAGEFWRLRVYLNRLFERDRLTLPGWIAACPDAFTSVATILLAGVDLFFRGKLEALLDGHHLVTTDSVDPPDLVIVRHRPRRAR